MLATFLFEFASALYVIWRYKMDVLARLITVTLLALGTFQLAEYMICGGLGIGGQEWARLGYVSITLLPAIGIHMVTVLSGKKAPLLVNAAYASMFAFAAYFALLPGVLNAHECRPNYAVFHLDPVSVRVFAVYYYGWLTTGALLTWHWSRNNKNAKALLWLTGGYLSFMLPTVTANLIDPNTIAGIPSIMCGFAVLLAIVLVAKVLPMSGTESRPSIQKAKRRA